MPVILMPEDYDRWLDADARAEALRRLFRPYDPALMKAYAVSRVVNSVKNDVPECIAPLADPEPPPQGSLGL
jgi:putative SOS response-associated peptidase YedK